ncbi:MAG TPA: hypothetical protein VFS21_12930 [Roseiflexaceae bacterium]|nr:hypothetical protein [Roseiflexaceae bacterium]
MTTTSHRLLPALALALLLTGCGANQAAAPTPLAEPTAAAEATQPAPPSPAPTVAPTVEPTAEPTASPTAPAVAAYLLGADGMLRRWSPGAGGPADVAALPADASSVSVAPGGGTVAFVAQGRAVVRNLADGTDADVTPDGLERLPDGQPISGFRWSPDGQSLLFDLDLGPDPICNPEAQIYVVSLPAAAARPLGPGLAPTWSPDGTRVAYAGPPFDCTTPFGGGPGGKLTVAAPDLSGARVLDPQEGIRPTGDPPQWHPILWSPDSRRVGAGAAVYDAASGAVVRRVEPQGGEYIGALWHLGQESVGYWRNVRTDSPPGRVSQAGDEVSFVEYDEFVSLSPDGRQVALARTALIDCPCLALARAAEVTWSADGATMLLFGQIAGDERSGLWRYNGRSAAEPVFLALLERANEAPPLLAPDGRYALLNVSLDEQPHVLAFPLDGGTPVDLGAGRALGWR